VAQDGGDVGVGGREVAVGVVGAVAEVGPGLVGGGQCLSVAWMGVSARRVCLPEPV
jgi:hypothetical protein